jgi:putative DNA primase/helicase
MVRIRGQTKNVPLHTRTFIGITGNGVQIAEDMARRILKTSLDAKMEDPEQRKFDAGFLDSVLAERPKLLTDALTIWRWGRQADLKRGKPLGNYEVWSQWCRDPLLALGCRDPVDRIAEIKAADPQRQALVQFFDIWWTIHTDNVVKTGDIGDQINEHADPKSSRKGDGTLIYNKQTVRRYLERHVNTRVAGYSFEQIVDKTKTRPVYYYKLKS